MKILFFLMGGVLLALNASAQDVPTTSKDGQPIRLISGIIKVPKVVEPGGVEPVDDSSADKVEIQDYVLDLETGNAALQVVSWKHTDRAKPVVAVAPFSPTVDLKQATKLAKEISTTEPPKLTRKLAAALHKTFGQDLYWSKYISGLGGVDKFDQEKYELIPFRSLKSKKIVDIDGDSLGTLTDVGLRPSGEIAYCVLQSSDDALRAIPLGAFLDREHNKNWKIELKREQVFQFAPFDATEVPQHIDRGWQEYVAVRYGRDTLQEVPKANPR